ncbi:MAG TPA: hypothetical protein VFJ06_14365 [Halococcus sp.]|nr:hypothetical protein [Halococcus sp.]
MSDRTPTKPDRPETDGGEATPRETVEQTVTDEQSSERSGISWKMALTAGVMGLIIGAFAAWATLNLGIASVAFLVGLVGGGYYLYRKPIPSAAIGSGLYITALVMILTPLLFYIPSIFSSSEGEGAAAAGAFIGSVFGLVIWGFVFLLFAIVTAAIGYFFSRRAKKKLAA